MTDDIRTNAEHVTLCDDRWAHEADESDLFEAVQRAQRVAAAWLAEHPADDGTPLTLDWINSVSGEGPVVNRGYTVSVGPLDYEPRAESVGGPISLWPTRDGDKVLLTRGDVRRVASAIGEPVVEPATTRGGTT